jgi:hypothetical protein
MQKSKPRKEPTTEIRYSKIRLGNQKALSRGFKNTGVRGTHTREVPTRNRHRDMAHG